MKLSIVEMTEKEVDFVAGGPLPVVAAAFVSGAKWGFAGVVSIYGIYKAAN